MIKTPQFHYAFFNFTMGVKGELWWEMKIIQLMKTVLIIEVEIWPLSFQQIRIYIQNILINSQVYIYLDIDNLYNLEFSQLILCKIMKMCF